MAIIPKPKIGELTIQEIEKHLTEECGLTVQERYEGMYIERNSKPTNTQLRQLEHPSSNLGGPDLWETEGFSETYDRVLCTKVQDRDKAKAQLIRFCMQGNHRRVSEMFYARGYWCVRVRDVEQ